MRSKGDENMFRFSEHGVENPEIYGRIYADFIEWCKTKVKSGTFSTYVDGEPVCFSNGVELSYRLYQVNGKQVT